MDIRGPMSFSSASLRTSGVFLYLVGSFFPLNQTYVYSRNRRALRTFGTVPSMPRAPAQLSGSLGLQCLTSVGTIQKNRFSVASSQSSISRFISFSYDCPDCDPDRGQHHANPDEVDHVVDPVRLVVLRPHVDAVVEPSWLVSVSHLRRAFRFVVMGVVDEGGPRRLHLIAQRSAWLRSLRFPLASPY